jgi:parallel beta-helix repeat protein
MKTLLPFLIILITLTACHKKKINWLNIEKDLQTQLIMAEDGDTIQIPAGYYLFTRSISVDEKNNIVIAGAGINKTILSFKGQSEGAEGLKITNGNNIIVRDLTIQDTKGDALKSQDINGISIINVRATWSGKPRSENGSYGIYPVSCTNVLIDGCEASGASDAGIYVGQSKYVIVRNCKAWHNVAGIEIENTLYADVYDNLAFDNTGGILTFDLPDLELKKGGYIRIFNNKIFFNNYKNFAPPGNIVAKVPAGTGLMILATSNVEAFDNVISRNKTSNIAIVSFLITGETIKDSLYDPYPKAIQIYNNDLHRGFFQIPDWTNDLGKLMLWKLLFRIPNIIYDGVTDPEALGENNIIKDHLRLCIYNNKEETFANVDFPNNFNNISFDLSPYRCTHPKINSVTFRTFYNDSLSENTASLPLTDQHHESQ